MGQHDAGNHEDRSANHGPGNDGGGAIQSKSLHQTSLIFHIVRLEKGGKWEKGEMGAYRTMVTAKLRLNRSLLFPIFPFLRFPPFPTNWRLAQRERWCTRL